MFALILLFRSPITCIVIIIIILVAKHCIAIKVAQGNFLFIFQEKILQKARRPACAIKITAGSLSTQERLFSLAH